MMLVIVGCTRNRIIMIVVMILPIFNSYLIFLSLLAMASGLIKAAKDIVKSLGFVLIDFCLLIDFYFAMGGSGML